MTVREALTLGDAMARLRSWRHNQQTLLYECRRRAELWKHRAQVEAERAERAERKLRQLERGQR